MSDVIVSETIWNREIAQGFQTLIPTVIGKYPVSVRKNDEDFKSEVYPSVVLQFLYSTKSNIRGLNRDNILVSVDKKNYVGRLEKIPQRYDISMQMDFLSESQSALDVMAIKWLDFQRNDFNLPVLTMGGLKDSVHVMPVGNAKRSDEVINTQRIFRCCFNYKIYGRISEHTGTSIKLLKEVVVNVKRTN